MRAHSVLQLGHARHAGRASIDAEQGRTRNLYSAAFRNAWRHTEKKLKENAVTPHGHFHWNELRTRNAERAKKFYSETIGWTFESMPTRDGLTYWVAHMNGKPVAGLFSLDEPQFKDVPESWISFLAVDDVDDRVAKATAAGAKLIMPIFDVPTVGRIAMLLEPSGAGIGWMTPAS